jgi:hypothetical protein
MKEDMTKKMMISGRKINILGVCVKLPNEKETKMRRRKMMKISMLRSTRM